MLAFRHRWDRLAIVYLVLALGSLLVACFVTSAVHGVLFTGGAIMLGAFLPLVAMHFVIKGMYRIR